MVAAWRRQPDLKIEATANEDVITETVRLTPLGGLSAFLLACSVIGGWFASAAATTVFQQIEAGIWMIAGVLLFGLGLVLGRSRTFRVVRAKV